MMSLQEKTPAAAKTKLSAGNTYSGCHVIRRSLMVYKPWVLLLAATKWLPPIFYCGAFDRWENIPAGMLNDELIFLWRSPAACKGL